MNELLTIENRDSITKFFFQVLNSINVGIIITDHNAKVLFINKMVCDYLHISPDEWIGKTAKQLVNEGYYDRSIAYETIDTGKQIVGVINTWNGLEVLSFTRPIKDNNGELKLIIATVVELQEFSTIKEQCKKTMMENFDFKELEYLRKLLLDGKELVSSSNEMKNLLKKIKKISSVDCTVLITGESGVGKEVVATLIHKNGLRKEGPFIPVTLPSIPQDLIESELFGYEAGAFTGSRSSGKKGLFELANGGTLFLDEIGDLNYDLQVKLLRTIETNEIRRVGGTKIIKLNARIIAATNRDLSTMMEKDLLRSDLYYRLNVVPIRIQPLRERPDDIQILSEHFLQLFNKKHGFEIEFSTCAIETLKDYYWPGNIRELKNVIERAVILSDSRVITSNDLRSIVSGLNKPTNSAHDKESIKDEYNRHEKNEIIKALKQTKGNKTRAAEILGISRTKLYYKLRKL